MEDKFIFSFLAPVLMGGLVFCCLYFKDEPKGICSHVTGN